MLAFFLLLVLFIPGVSVAMQTSIEYMPQRASAVRAANSIALIFEQERKKDGEIEQAVDALQPSATKYTGKRKSYELYTCQIEGCTHTCSSKENLPRHWLGAHKLNYLYECSVCKEHLKDFYTFKRHGKEHLRKNESCPSGCLLKEAPWYPIRSDIILKKSVVPIAQPTQNRINQVLFQLRKASHDQQLVLPRFQYIVGQGRCPMKILSALLGQRGKAQQPVKKQKLEVIPESSTVEL